MDPNVIEEEAVQEIIYKANRSSPALQAAIPMGDKGISLDGEILVFQDNERQKKSRPTRCRVQVKGQKVTKFSDKTTKRKVELEDLRNYIQHKSVIYFVVEIDEELNRKVFFKLLTLIEIDKLIRKNSKQKTKTLEFVSLGEEKDALFKLCKRCIYHKNIQMQLPGDRKYDIKRKTLFTPNIDITYDSIPELFNHDAIVKAGRSFPKNDGIKFPRRKLSLPSVFLSSGSFLLSC